MGEETILEEGVRRGKKSDATTRNWILRCDMPREADMGRQAGRLRDAYEIPDASSGRLADSSIPRTTRNGRIPFQVRAVLEEDE